MQFENIPVYDLYPPIEISVSPFLYLIVVFLLVASITGLVMWKKRLAGNDIRVNTEKKRYQALVSVNMSDPKYAAYEISSLGYELVKEKPELLDTYVQLNRLLEPHKYALRVEPFSQQVIDVYKEFCSKVYEKIS